MKDLLRVDIASGKYTVVQDATGYLKALRHRDKWLDKSNGTCGFYIKEEKYHFGMFCGEN